MHLEQTCTFTEARRQQGQLGPCATLDRGACALGRAMPTERAVRAFEARAEAEAGIVTSIGLTKEAVKRCSR
jgi:hypothetical protein